MKWHSDFTAVLDFCRCCFATVARGQPSAFHRLAHLWRTNTWNPLRGPNLAGGGIGELPGSRVVFRARGPKADARALAKVPRSARVTVGRMGSTLAAYHGRSRWGVVGFGTPSSWLSKVAPRHCPSRSIDHDVLRRVQRPTLRRESGTC